MTVLRSGLGDRRRPGPPDQPGHAARAAQPLRRGRRHGRARRRRGGGAGGGRDARPGLRAGADDRRGCARRSPRPTPRCGTRARSTPTCGAWARRSRRVALVGGDEGRDVLALANVGDSRAYVYSDGRLVQVTADHSLAEERMRHGEMTEAEAAVHPQRHILTRALGVSSEVQTDMWELQLQRGRPGPALLRRPVQRGRHGRDGRHPRRVSTIPRRRPSASSTWPTTTAGPTTSPWSSSTSRSARTAPTPPRRSRRSGRAPPPSPWPAPAAAAVGRRRPVQRQPARVGDATRRRRRAARAPAPSAASPTPRRRCRVHRTGGSVPAYSDSDTLAPGSRLGFGGEHDDARRGGRAATSSSSAPTGVGARGAHVDPGPAPTPQPDRRRPSARRRRAGASAGAVWASPGASRSG